MLEKQWKSIIINDQETFYSVSNYGEVRNNSTKTLLKGYVSNNGYRMVHLRQRIDKMCSVHRLVMKAFCPCENMDDLQINHKDGNKLNNYIENLEWSTALKNMRHSLQPKKMIPCYQYDLDGNYITEFVNGHEAAKKLNLDYNNIWRCLTEQQYHYKQYQFKSYKRDKIKPWYNVNNKKIYVYDDKGKFLTVYENQKKCAEAFGVTESSISKYINETRKLKDFVFSRIPL